MIFLLLACGVPTIELDPTTERDLWSPRNSTPVDALDTDTDTGDVPEVDTAPVQDTDTDTDTGELAEDTAVDTDTDTGADTEECTDPNVQPVMLSIDYHDPAGTFVFDCGFLADVNCTGGMRSWVGISEADVWLDTVPNADQTLWCTFTFDIGRVVLPVHYESGH